MADMEREWAGRERVFRLSFGGVLDLEEATDGTVGALFNRLRDGTFGAGDVVHTVRLALIGGGMDRLAAKRLVHERFDTEGLLEMSSVAADMLLAIMVGVEPSGEAKEDAAPRRYRFSEVVQICREFNMSPQDLRDQSYSDFINMVRGFNAASKDNKVEPPTEEEFEAMLARDEERTAAMAAAEKEAVADA